MSKFTVEINCDNDAFAGHTAGEVQRILKDICRDLKYENFPLHRNASVEKRLFDENGNTVGFIDWNTEE